MRLLNSIVLLVTATRTIACITELPSIALQTRNMISFSTFSTIYPRRYDNDAEKIYREQVFTSNKNKINSNNADKGRSYKLSVNKFADLTEEEFIAKYGGLLPWSKEVQRHISDKAELKKLEDQQCLCDFERNAKIQELKKNIVENKIVQKEGEKAATAKAWNQKLIQSIKNKEITDFATLINQNPNKNTSQSLITAQTTLTSQPQNRLLQLSNVDWTNSTGPVIEQGSCGSCYAAATVQTVEALYSIYVFGGLHIKLSIQQIVDCSNTVFDGCLGGWLQSSYQFIQDFGVTSHFQYPYSSGQSGSSQACLMPTGQFKIKQYLTVQNSCTNIRSMLNTRPVSAGISGGRLQFYDSGTFDDCVNSLLAIDHAVIIVRYTPTKGWRIKNSWGSDWGESGFAWITGDQTKNCGLCRIASSAYLQNQ